MFQSSRSYYLTIGYIELCKHYRTHIPKSFESINTVKRVENTSNMTLLREFTIPIRLLKTPLMNTLLRDLIALLLYTAKKVENTVSKYIAKRFEITIGIHC